ncbi:MAG: hypothetical protein Q8S31_07260 [Alphaproteobacteria bacterium]|nr:hypothetical protein [Alphaproteobacteria bacterium]
MFLGFVIRNATLQIIIISIFTQLSFAGITDPIVTHYNSFIIFKDYIEGMEILHDKKKLEKINMLDEKDFFEISSLSYPIIIKNKSDFLVAIIPVDLSSPCFIAPHETIINYIDDKENFRLYRIDLASSINNISNTIGAVSAITTIATSTFFLISAPLSIPTITSAAMLGGASYKVYKWITSLQKDFSIAGQEIDPARIIESSIAKMTINNTNNEISISSTLKILDATQLMNKFLKHIPKKLNDLSSKNDQLLNQYQKQFDECSAFYDNNPSFNHKVAQLYLLYQQLTNILTPPKQTSMTRKLIKFVKNSENHAAIMALVKALT